jgi:hypothetical protein
MPIFLSQLSFDSPVATKQALPAAERNGYASCNQIAALDELSRIRRRHAPSTAPVPPWPCLADCGPVSRQLISTHQDTTCAVYLYRCCALVLYFSSCDIKEMLHSSPVLHFDQGDAIDTAAGQHKVAVGGCHHVADEPTAGRDRPSLKGFSLWVEAHEGIRILPRLTVPSSFSAK